MPLHAEPGVRFDVIAAAGFELLRALASASKALGRDLTITSGTDGDHSGPLDPHKLGCAYDVRSHDLDPHQKDDVLYRIMCELGTPSRASGGYVTDKFFGWLEDEAQPGEHFHFQLRHGMSYP